MSNFLNDKAINKPITSISKSDENFLREFSRDFHQIITNTNDFNALDNNLNEWINNIDKNILELMQYHNENDLLFSSIIGFFYQYGIACNVDENKALEMYSLAVNNEESLNQEFINLHLLEESNNDVDL